MWVKEEKKIRWDKKKNIAKVAEELLNNPLSSVREVAEKTWVSKSTVANYINKDLDKLGQKDKSILEVCNVDFDIVKIWQEIIKQRLQDKEEVSKMRTFEIAQTIEKSEKRYMLFKWDITNNDWWLKEININQSQMELIANRILNGQRDNSSDTTTE